MQNTTSSSPTSDLTINSAEFDPPIAPESASTHFASIPHLLNILIYAACILSYEASNPA